MEAHPVPQNVTSFQFKLVGDMTLKQFLYLATGVGFAYLVFVFLAARVPVLAWPVMVISSGLGIAFAFLPIRARPLDHWLKAYIRAIYSPTKMVWLKNNKIYTNEPMFGNRLNIYLSTPAPKPQPQSQTPPQQQVNLKQLVMEKTIAPENLPSEEQLMKTVELGKKAQALQVKMLEAERELRQLRIRAQQNQGSSEDLTSQANEVFNNLQALTQEASSTRNQLAGITKQQISPAPKIEVKIIQPPKPKITQIALTSFPNVLNGIVVDTERNYVEGVVIVINDKDGLPVRALKTNKLGQFTGSTPLPNGTYTIELEKDNMVFDVLQIELKGAVLPPLMISAKQIVASS